MTRSGKVACNRCITKKRRCPGDYLLGKACRLCINAGVECSYPERRSSDLIESLQKRVKELESQIEDRDALPEPFGTSLGYIAGTLVYQDFGLKNNITKSSSDQFSKLLSDANQLTESFEYYFTSVHSRYPFLSQLHLKALHDNRASLFKSQESTSHQYKVDKFILLMVYAIGSRASDHHEVFYYQAASLDIGISSERAERSVIQALLLVVIYHLNVDNGRMIWHLVGSILRLCVNAGYNRANLVILREDPYEYLMNCRTFWAAYCLDRIVSNCFGKPYCLSDSEIDVDLPLDLDESIVDPVVIKQRFYQEYPHNNLEGFPITERVNPSRSSMSVAIIHFKLRRIESMIKTSIYRLDQPFEMVSRSEIQRIIEKIDTWRDDLPKWLTADEFNYWIYMYHKQIKYLIQPFLSKLPGEDELFQQCIKSSIMICNLSRSIHNNPKNITLVSLQIIFLSGINMIYGLVSKKYPWNIEISEGIRNCTAFLVTITDKSKNFAKYRDVFERLLNQTKNEEFDKTTFIDKFPFQFFGYDSMDMRTGTNVIPPVDILFGQTQEAQTYVGPDSNKDLEILFDLHDLYQNLTDLSPLNKDWRYDL